jgi:hypothetical protein
MLSKNDFIQRATLIHGNNYDYTQVDYRGCFKKVTIICHLHGVFIQQPDSHLHGTGCPKCGHIKKGKSHNIGIKNFIARAKETHGNIYDYSETVYSGMRKKLLIRCPTHGVFEQCAYNHLIGQGCPKCKGEKVSKSCRKEVDTFIADSFLIHGDKYDYSQVEYKTARKKVSIICPKHGKFYQTPTSHLHGCGCPHCGNHVSKWEFKLLSFVQTICSDTVGSYRGWCPNHPNREIDIFIPSLNIGFECNGVYWHKIITDNDGIDKIKEAKEVGISLYVLWDNISIDENKAIISTYIRKEMTDGSR